MSDENKKVSAEDVLENHMPSEIAMALMVNDAKISCQAFTDQFRDLNKPGHPIDWDVVDYHGVPRQFVYNCELVANTEVLIEV